MWLSALTVSLLLSLASRSTPGKGPRAEPLGVCPAWAWLPSQSGSPPALSSSLPQRRCWPGEAALCLSFVPLSGVLIQALIVRVSRASEVSGHLGLAKPVFKPVAWNKLSPVSTPTRWRITMTALKTTNLVWCFACMYICVPCLCLVPAEARGGRASDPLVPELRVVGSREASCARVRK